MKAPKSALARAAALGLACAAPLWAAGTAAADPFTDILVNTTCSYPQVTAAMKAQAPALAAQLDARPDMQAGLQAFLAMPVDQRQQQLQAQQAANPQLQAMLAAQLGPQLTKVANTCATF